MIIPLIRSVRDEEVRGKLTKRLDMLYRDYFIPPAQIKDYELEKFDAGDMLNDEMKIEMINIAKQIVDKWNKDMHPVAKEDFLHTVVLPEFLAFAVMKNQNCSRYAADTITQEAIARNKIETMDSE